MNQPRYILEPYHGPGTRYTCPQCGKRKEFVRYIDQETGQYLANHVGRCNRESSCGYHYKPRQYFQEKPRTGREWHKSATRPTYRKRNTEQTAPVSVIPFEIFKKSLKDYSRNNFVKYLLGLFGPEVATRLIERFYIGTSKQWNWKGATVFWQVDFKGNIRTGKIMLYNPETGKRVKQEGRKYFHWAHRLLNLNDFHLEQCLFGEHQLRTEPKDQPVAVVESEKTAIIASVYFPDYIWLATGGLSNLKPDKCKPLAGRDVVLFPDLGAAEKWKQKGRELRERLSCEVRVSDFLERRATATEKLKGLDLADYLVKYDYHLFHLTETELEALQERAAIMEYDGGLPRQQAEHFALEGIKNLFTTN